jgi:hypothetical protein
VDDCVPRAVEKSNQGLQYLVQGASVILL